MQTRFAGTIGLHGDLDLGGHSEPFVGIPCIWEISVSDVLGSRVRVLGFGSGV